MFGRLDALVDFTSPMWKESLRFVEPNLMGIGGLHIVPACERLIESIVVPMLRSGDVDLDLAAGKDIRELLTAVLLEHMAAIGAGPNVCFVEPKYAGNGPDEQALLARYLHERHGLTVMHADPSELTLRAGVVWYQDQRVDLAYRDYGVVDLLELEAEGVDVEPMRVLLRENRVVSSIAADLDQKSLLGGAHRSPALPAALHSGRAADLPAPHPVDPRAGRPAHGASRTVARATSSTSRAGTTRSWCSSRTVPTAATGS